MAIKAREDVRKTNFGAALWIGIAVVVLFIAFFFDKVIAMLPTDLQRPVSLTCYIVTLIVFLYLLVYTSLWYSMFLSHKELYIERHFLFFHWDAATILCKDFVEITAVERYSGKARPKNYTIMQLEGFGKYVLTYKENNELKAAKIQCTRRFHRQIVQLIELNQKTAEAAAKSKKKKNK